MKAILLAGQCFVARHRRGGWRCVTCGRKFPRQCLADCARPARQLPAAERSPLAPHDCPHLGEVLYGDDDAPATELVPCRTCGGVDGQVPTTVFACGKHGECLPLARLPRRRAAEYASRPDAVRLCDGCPDNPRTARG
ncbi:MAG: hypothetical protein KDA44_10400 [Planctomycetales bacterium]|nr:hypothetical protein [Planctomycetales bacterium]